MIDSHIWVTLHFFLVCRRNSERKTIVKKYSKDYLNISCCNWLNISLHKFGKAYPNGSGKHDWVSSLVVWNTYGSYLAPFFHVFSSLLGTLKFHPSHPVLRQPRTDQKACHGVSGQSWDVGCVSQTREECCCVKWNHLFG